MPNCPTWFSEMISTTTAQSIFAKTTICPITYIQWTIAAFMVLSRYNLLSARSYGWACTGVRQPVLGTRNHSRYLETQYQRDWKNWGYVRLNHRIKRGEGQHPKYDLYRHFRYHLKPGPAGKQEQPSTTRAFLSGL